MAARPGASGLGGPGRGRHGGGRRVGLRFSLPPEGLLFGRSPRGRSQGTGHRSCWWRRPGSRCPECSPSTRRAGQDVRLQGGRDAWKVGRKVTPHRDGRKADPGESDAAYGPSGEGRTDIPVGSVGDASFVTSTSPRLPAPDEQKGQHLGSFSWAWNLPLQFPQA